MTKRWGIKAMMIRMWLWLSAVVLLCVCVSLASAREWKSRTGRLRVEAEYVETTGNMVRLRRTSDGKIISFPILFLSQADQEYIKERQQQPDDEDTDDESSETVPVKSDAKPPIFRITPSASKRAGLAVEEGTTVKPPTAPSPLTPSQVRELFGRIGDGPYLPGSPYDSIKVTPWDPHASGNAASAYLYLRETLFYHAHPQANKPGGFATFSFGGVNPHVAITLTLATDAPVLIDLWVHADWAQPPHSDMAEMTYRVSGTDIKSFKEKQRAPGGKRIQFFLDPVSPGRTWIIIKGPAEGRENQGHWSFLGCEIFSERPRIRPRGR